MTNKHYCPFCQRDISPDTDPETGEPLILRDGADPQEKGGFLYIHDDVPHDPDYTFEALQ